MIKKEVIVMYGRIKKRGIMYKGVHFLCWQDNQSFFYTDDKIGERKIKIKEKDFLNFNLILEYICKHEDVFYYQDEFEFIISLNSYETLQKIHLLFLKRYRAQIDKRLIQSFSSVYERKEDLINDTFYGSEQRDLEGIDEGYIIEFA